MMGAVVQFVGVICLSQYLANRFGKRNTFKVCLTMTAFLTALFYIPEPTDVGLLFLMPIHVRRSVCRTMRCRD